MGEHYGSFKYLLFTLFLSIIIGVSGTTVFAQQSESTDLINFIYDASITGARQEDGKYVVDEDATYEINLYFREKNTLQFDDDQPLTYQIPEGIDILERQTGTLTTYITEAGREYPVTANYVLETNGQLSITFDPNDENYHRLLQSTNTRFHFGFNAQFGSDAHEIDFGNYVKRELIYESEIPGKVVPTKSSSFDENTGTMTYTITLTADKAVTNVNVKDIISGSALTNISTPVVSGNSSAPTINSNTNGFDYTFPSMEAGETITITYTADVDFSKDTGKTGKISANLTANTVTTQPEGGDPFTAGDSREINYQWTDKSDGSVADTIDGNKIISWTVKYNELALVSAAGNTITDAIASASQQYMTYYGDGITVKVYDNSGNLVRTDNVSYEDLTAHSETGWTYTIPYSDTDKYSYEITYQTIVDQSKIDTSGVTQTLHNTANGDDGAIGIFPGATIDVTKSVESIAEDRSEVTWVSTLYVPEAGLSEAIVTDTLPHVYWGGDLFDTIKSGSL